MEYVRLGSTGTKVSRLCLGCMSFGSSERTPWSWVLEEEASRPIIRQALEAGINFFDTANSYSRGRSEEILGKALKDFGPGRDRVVIATKVFNPMGDDPNQRGLSRKNIMHAIDDSLSRLGTDYIDLYQIHRHDPTTPMEETLEALNDIVRAGKVRYIGASSMRAWEFSRYLHLSEKYGLARFVTMQNRYNLAYREEEREMNPLCRFEGVGLIPYSSMAGGVLAGTRRQGGTVRANDPRMPNHYRRPNDEAIVDQVAAVAEQRGAGMAQVALAWVLAKPGVTAPIIGATKQHHLPELLAALDLKLSDDEIASLEKPYIAQPLYE